MDYDTWKTTDFEYERQCEEEEALEEARQGFGTDLYCAYFNENGHAISEVEDRLADQMEEFCAALREGHATKEDQSVAVTHTYRLFISKMCDEIAENLESHDAIERAYTDLKL